MGYSLSGRKRDFGMTCDTYRAVLKTAYESGWVPKGAHNPEIPIEAWGSSEPRYIPPKHPVGYFGNGGQLVTDEDAAGIALALDRYLSTSEARGVAKEYFTELARAFARFCDEGEFLIF